MTPFTGTAQDLRLEIQRGRQYVLRYWLGLLMSQLLLLGIQFFLS